MSEDRKKLSNPLTLGMALAAGTGLVLMMIALGIGVVQPNAAGNAVGATFALGLVLFLLGVVAWAVVTRPFAHYDDINVPMDTGHHGHDAHAIVVAPPHAIQPLDEAPHAESHP